MHVNLCREQMTYKLVHNEKGGNILLKYDKFLKSYKKGKSDILRDIFTMTHDHEGL